MKRTGNEVVLLVKVVGQEEGVSCLSVILLELLWKSLACFLSYEANQVFLSPNSCFLPGFSPQLNLSLRDSQKIVAQRNLFVVTPHHTRPVVSDKVRGMENAIKKRS
jgi:hypothetical protein